jgi:uncharacterized membrane protein YdcZ (DUF606 family)
MKVDSGFSSIAGRESDFARRLTQPQLTMIAIYGAIGAGLLLGIGSTLFVPQFRMTPMAGISTLLVLTAAYLLSRRRISTSPLIREAL